MTRDKAIAELVRIWHSPHLDLSLKAGLAEAIETLKEKNQSDSLVTDSSDDCKESESKLDLISRQDAIEAIESRQTEQWIESDIDYNSGLESALCEIKALPSAEPKTDEENELKFYYVESIDDYWIGQRLDNFYYADWHDRLGFVWSKSRYLPWGEHIVNENTLWKEHTYPSEPIEIPFTEWIRGFVKKYFAEPNANAHRRR